jgi:hypothetical protein
MSKLSCECRKKHAARIKENYEREVLSLKSANEKLVSFMKTKYMDVSIQLKKDFRIFAGANTIVMLLLVIISFLKTHAIRHLFFPATLLFISTIFCSYFYIFEQNWFFSIIYNDYLGWTYFSYLGVVFLFLCDIVLNRARVTCKILNAIAEAIGSAFSVMPC